MKVSRKVFSEDNEVQRIDCGNGDVLALRKTSLDRSESVLMLFNLCGSEQEVRLPSLLKALNAPALENLNLPGQAAVPSRIRLHSWGVAILQL
jgi:hypothetical protein